MSVTSPDDGEVTCPVCGDYTGTPSSVEAHVTGKSDDKHRGKTGFQVREELEQVPVPDDLDDTGQTELSDSDTVSVPDESSSGPEQNGDGPGIGTGILLGIVAVLLWVANRNRGPENQIQTSTGPGPGPSDGFR